MASAVFFDLWNTLLYCPTPKKIREMIRQTGLEGKADYSEVKDYMDNTLFVRKDYDVERFITDICGKYGVECSQNQLRGAAETWESRLAEAKYFPEVKQALSDLKGDYSLGLISNTDRTGAEYARKTDLNKYFDCIVLSYEAGYAKPNRRIYEMAVEELGVKPAECWMVGDSVTADVEGAHKAGLNALLLDREGRHDKQRYPTIRDLTEVRMNIK